jgi:hypothetical protein
MSSNRQAMTERSRPAGAGEGRRSRPSNWRGFDPRRASIVDLGNEGRYANQIVREALSMAEGGIR